jgi:hypothetical protein
MTLNPPKPSPLNPKPPDHPRSKQTNKRKQTNKHTSRYGPVGPNRENRRYRRKRYHSAALQQRSGSHCT